MGCAHVPSEKDRTEAETRYDLAVQLQANGDVQGSLKELNRALELYPRFDQAHNLKGILLHISFGRHEEAIPHYKRALEIKPDYSEAKTNLGNVYLDLGRYDEALALYEEALNDTLYPTPYIAYSNKGWAQYKKGDVKGGMESIRMAVTTNPKFCLGYKNLGLIHGELGQHEESCTQFAHYKEQCPSSGEAYYLSAMCLLKLDRQEEARKDLAACQAKSVPGATQDTCKRLLQQLQ
jgi:Tfp pilus assembly protein PilF